MMDMPSSEVIYYSAFEGALGLKMKVYAQSAYSSNKMTKKGWRFMHKVPIFSNKMTRKKT